MEFTILLSDFQKVLQKVLPAVPPKSTVAVLEHLYFKLRGNKLQIIATDQNITISSKVTVESQSEGEVLVPARMLNDIVKALGTTGSIKFKVNLEGLDITITTARGSYEMKGLSADEFIDLPQLFDGNDPTLAGEEGVVSSTNNGTFFTKDQITRLSDKTIFCVSTDEFRISMMGVLFQFRETYVNAVATDSFRLSRATVRSEGAIFPQDFDLLLPSKSIEILRKVDTDVHLSTIDSYGKITHARFDIGDTTFISRVINEKFPPYESVLPKENNLVVLADIDEFISSLKRVSLFSNEKSKQVKLSISSNTMKIFTEDEDTGRHGEESIGCEFNGESIDLAFNYKFVLEALEHIDSKDTEGNLFKMLLSLPNKPVLFLPNNDNDDLLLLVMPVRINNN
ncbi:DNA polymerase III subunit beta [Candidatus Kapaibacterium sp.]